MNVPEARRADNEGPGGDRASAKVRRVARARRDELGALRFVETVRPGRWLWLVIGGIWAVCAIALVAGYVAGNNDAANLWMLVVFAAMLLVVVWLVASEKLLVFERGIVLGSFLPGTRPMALPFHTIDPRTIRASVGFPQRHGMPKLLAGHTGFGGSNTQHHCMWSPYAVTFIGPNGYLVRGAGTLARARRTTVLQPGEAPSDTLWVFGTLTGPRLERVVRALADALGAAGIVDPHAVVGEALPARRITGTFDDAAYLCIPAHQRADDLPR